MLLTVITLALAAGSGTTRADGARDVSDIRMGKLPILHEWLGWDDTGAANLRSFVCSDGGTETCRVSFLRARPDAKGEATTVLDINEVYCSPAKRCEPLDRRTVSRFIAAEQAAIAALPALRRMTPAEADPLGVFGAVVGLDTRVAIRAIDASTPDDTKVVVQLVVRATDGSVETLATLDDRVFRLNASKIVEARKSPDGRAALFVVQTSVGVMCWDFDSLPAVAVDIPRHRASLANTMGFRAWRRKDLAFALRAFTEATTTDPTFGLGWYNRAAVESRDGDLTSACASFGRALAIDAAFASRGCDDPDFVALRAAEPALFVCSKKSH